MPEYKVIVDKYGIYWYKPGTNELHREDGPAVERANGYKEWWLNGKLHREDGPAIEWDDGSKSWYLNGKPHREDGPAIEYADGYKEWWLNGKQYTEKQLNKKMNQLSCDGKVVEIEGKTYKLVEVKQQS